MKYIGVCMMHCKHQGSTVHLFKIFSPFPLERRPEVGDKMIEDTITLTVTSTEINEEGVLGIHVEVDSLQDFNVLEPLWVGLDTSVCVDSLLKDMRDFQTLVETPKTNPQ